MEPTRMCIGCRQAVPRLGLIRLVAIGSEVRVENSGHVPGRGAYLHPGCVAQALGSGRVASALRITLGPDQAARLRQELERIVHV